MIKVEHTEVMGWESAIRGMRNPMNSWDKGDSHTNTVIVGNGEHKEEYLVGENDLTLMKKLAKAGTDHRKFMRMIKVACDINAPLYWWKEFDTYKVGTVANSCSTMHKIHSKEFTLDDFSCEHLSRESLYLLDGLIKCLNVYLGEFIKSNDKSYWWQVIQLLPSSYNQKRTVQLNYEVLANMYKSRKNHKLDEWHNFCKWVKSLPYSELITGGE